MFSVREVLVRGARLDDDNGGGYGVWRDIEISVRGQPAKEFRKVLMAPGVKHTQAPMVGLVGEVAGSAPVEGKEVGRRPRSE
jgi:hypothetical protein